MAGLPNGSLIMAVIWIVVRVPRHGLGVYYYLSDDLPKISTLTDYRPPAITTVYSDDNRKIAEFYKERRIILPLSKFPRPLIDAFVAAEDSRFFTHQGIDLVSIVRAFFKNLEAGTIVQGGSTITQQVTKSFLLTPERSYTRKLKEAILAYRIDKSFTKEEILYLYLNQIYLGHGAYGVAAAAENYFGKAVNELNLAECAILAGLPQAPSRYSPFSYPGKGQTAADLRSQPDGCRRVSSPTSRPPMPSMRPWTSSRAAIGISKKSPFSPSMCDGIWSRLTGRTPFTPAG